MNILADSTNTRRYAMVFIGLLLSSVVTAVMAGYDMPLSIDLVTNIFQNITSSGNATGNTSAEIEAVIGANASYTAAGGADGYEVDTNASQACDGDTTYLDGGNQCDDISLVYYDSEADLTTLLDNNYADIDVIPNTSEQIEAAIGANESYTRTYNETYDLALVTTIYYPNVTLTTGGVNITDNITLMGYVDHKSYNITEGNGVNPLTVYVNYTGITSFSQWIVNEYYEGSASHHIEFQIYLYDSDEWETHDDIVGQSGFTTEVKHIYDDDMHIKDGVVMTRFIHMQSGSTSHKFDIDYAWLTEGADIASSTNLAGYAEYNFASNPFTGSGNFTTTGTGTFKNLVITAAETGWNLTCTDTNITNVSAWFAQSNWLNTSNLTTCAGTQIMKMSGGAWLCGDDATGAAGAVGNVSGRFNVTGDGFIFLGEGVDDDHGIYFYTAASGAYGKKLIWERAQNRFQFDGYVYSTTGFWGDGSLLTGLPNQNSDTNATTECVGTTTYLDGEGDCDDISLVYESEAHCDEHDGAYLSCSVEELDVDAASICSYCGFTDTVIPDTNASTKCAGTTTYLDGENNCDDISAVYYDSEADLTGILDDNYAPIGSLPTDDWVNVTGDRMTGNLSVTGTANITGVGEILFRGNQSSMEVNTTGCIIIQGPTSRFDIC